ncbi:hypothetical protein C8J98_1085 [Luteibacter sp. OK325]|jgi:hypothetical protein|nr:hypothetical protein C8J98_1085 [Luteibacter sp. OK325]
MRELNSYEITTVSGGLFPGPNCSFRAMGMAFGVGALPGFMGFAGGPGLGVGAVLFGGSVGVIAQLNQCARDNRR